MGLRINGSLLNQLQSEAWDFDPQRGYRHTLSYRGATPLLMLALQQDFARAGIANRLVYEQGSVCVLEADDSTMQYTIDVWQLLGNSEAISVFNHPIVRERMTEDEIALLRQSLENQELPSKVFAPAPCKLCKFKGTEIERFYSLHQRGSTDYKRGQYVLRHTTNASSRWTTNLADVGVDQIYSPAKLLTEVQDGGAWIYPLPTRLSYKIAHIPAATPQPNYLWGWLKSSSTETTAANNRIEISTEYTLEQWSTDLYVPY